jgi:hypothetical protein
MKFLLLLASAAAFAQNTLTPEEKKAGWKLLFDGKTMSGWQKPAGDGWGIEDACLKARPKPHLREDLVTAAAFRDFELTWEWKISAGGNSGLKYGIQDFVPITEESEKRHQKFEDAVAEQYRSRSVDRATVAAKGGQIYVVGFEFQMIDDNGHKDARRGPLYPNLRS